MNTTLQCVEVAPLDAFQVGFCAASTGVETCFFRFLEDAVTDMLHQGLLDIMLTWSLEPLSQSCAFKNALNTGIKKQTLKQYSSLFSEAKV